MSRRQDSLMAKLIDGFMAMAMHSGSDQMKKAQKKVTLSKIDFLSSVIIIGLD